MRTKPRKRCQLERLKGRQCQEVSMIRASCLRVQEGQVNRKFLPHQEQVMLDLEVNDEAEWSVELTLVAVWKACRNLINNSNPSTIRASLTKPMYCQGRRITRVTLIRIAVQRFRPFPQDAKRSMSTNAWIVLQFCNNQAKVLTNQTSKLMDHLWLVT